MTVTVAAPLRVHPVPPASSRIHPDGTFSVMEYARPGVRLSKTRGGSWAPRENELTGNPTVVNGNRFGTETGVVAFSMRIVAGSSAAEIVKVHSTFAGIGGIVSSMSLAPTSANPFPSWLHVRPDTTNPARLPSVVSGPMSCGPDGGRSQVTS